MIIAGRQPGRSATLIRRTALEQGERDYPLIDGQLGHLTTWIRTAVAGWGFSLVPEPHAIVTVHRGQMSATEDPACLIGTLDRFEFSDPVAEAARRARLADARRRNALSLACRGRLGAARGELERAAVTAPWPPPLRALDSLAAQTPALHRLSVRYPRLGELMHRVRARVVPPAPR